MLRIVSPLESIRLVKRDTGLVLPSLLFLALKESEAASPLLDWLAYILLPPLDSRDMSESRSEAGLVYDKPESRTEESLAWKEFLRFAHAGVVIGGGGFVVVVVVYVAGTVSA